MSRSDAERALRIYTDFTKQTDLVVSYLSTARQYQHQTRVDIPKLKHAPVNLAKQLEDYLADPDFEINRRQYLAEQEAKKNKGSVNGSSKTLLKNNVNEGESRGATDKTFPSVPSTQPAAKPTQQAKGPDPDLIDFFDSIEQNQQPMATQPVQQQTSIPNFAEAGQYQIQQPSQFQPQNGFGVQPAGFQDSSQFQQPVNPPFMQQQHNLQGQAGPQIQPNFTGAGFGGYTPQPSFQPTSLPTIPQDNPASFPSQGMQPFGALAAGPQTNPFRISMMAPTPSGLPGPPFPISPPTTSPVAPQSTNPFKSFSSQQPSQQFNTPTPQFQQLQQGTPTASPLQSSSAGTNPFARNANQPALQRPPTSGAFIPQPTGSTNPFRQSQFGASGTGSGWQNNQQPIGGGLDNLETIPVFPRPAQQQTWQQ
jgi:phosphatidylinositol-binding clathrin assembly protein